MKASRFIESKSSKFELLLAATLLMLPAAGIFLDYINVASLRTSILVLLPLAVVVAGALYWRSSGSQAARLTLYGLLAGFVATLAYDGVRVVLFWLGVVSWPFKSIELYGFLILGTDSEMLAQRIGWLFHFWNGASFGVFFALAFGRPTIFKGILWGLFLELALVITSPRVLYLTIQGELFTSSLIGHIAYGTALARVVSLANVKSSENQLKKERADS